MTGGSGPGRPLASGEASGRDPATSEVGQLLAGLARRYPAGRIGASVTFLFAVDDEEWTIRLAPDSAQVAEGRPPSADCEVRLSKPLFIEIATGRRSATPMDFLSGAIRASNPLLLKDLADALRG
jgi:hypothetical protein